MLVRILVSFGLGMAIGVEREVHHHPAGIRTFILLTMGSTLATIASIYICQTNLNLLNGDPGRIAAQVLTGIGFIGAGLIIKNLDRVSGLTSAASVFIAACIGIAVGVGLIVPATLVTLLTLVTLISSRLFKRRWYRQNKE